MGYARGQIPSSGRFSKKGLEKNKNHLLQSALGYILARVRRI